ncbi:hypothetical protein FMK62_24550 [Klebsiella grimontii]|uniref:hypothetical protein n=1 Tax=Klebsiella grimontii TaxID=2058152 RepID=UPI001CCF4BF5|nr:hypothetical protein [Klebsiella grimontii]MBZ7216170.1 hypothetical protein [Klebsiella grimontii]
MNIKEMDPFFTIAKQEAERRQSAYRGDEESNTGYKNLCMELEALAEEKVGRIVRRELKLGEVVNEWEFVESDANFAARFKGDYNLYLYASFFLYHWGLHVYSTEDSLSGVRFMIQASTYAGYWKGARERDEWLEGEEVARQAKRDSGKKVGEGRAAYFQPVRDELVRLLMAECPGEGWRFKTEAAKAVLAKLQIFIDANGIELKTDNLESTVLRWSSAKYPDVEAAFAQVVRKHS